MSLSISGISLYASSLFLFCLGFGSGSDSVLSVLLSTSFSSRSVSLLTLFSSSLTVVILSPLIF